MRHPLALSCLALLACTGGGDPDPWAEVTVTVDGAAEDWGEAIAIFATAGDAFTLSITRQDVTGSSLLVVGPTDALPGTVETFGPCPSGSELPTVVCAGLIVDDDPYDTPAGSFTVDHDPVPAAWEEGDMDLAFVAQGGGSPARFEASWGGICGGY